MKPLAREQIRARVTAKLDLNALTHEDAMLAVLDRALLWSELENSWWANVRKGLAYIAAPAALISLLLWLLAPRLKLWLALMPIYFATGFLIGAWLRDLLTLAREGMHARTLSAMHAAVRASPASPEGEAP